MPHGIYGTLRNVESLFAILAPTKATFTDMRSYPGFAVSGENPKERTQWHS